MTDNQKTEGQLISVIVPVYKSEAYLEACVDSILAQTYKNLEIILIDDGSPDRCGEICDAYASADVRVRVIHKENGGVAAARNCGLAAAKGDYITFVDADDMIHRSMLQESHNAFVRFSETDVVCFGIACFYGTPPTESLAKETIVKRMDRETAYKAYLQFDIMPSSCAKLYRRVVIENICFAPLQYAEDVDFSSRVMANSSQVALLDKTLYYYRQHDDSAVHGSAYDEPVQMALDGYTVDCSRYAREQIQFPMLASESAARYAKGLMRAYTRLRREGDAYADLLAQIRVRLRQIDPTVLTKSVALPLRLFNVSPAIFAVMLKLRDALRKG